MPPLLVVAAIIEDCAGRVLLGQRLTGKHHAGLWEFPGGKVEPGETTLVALKREALEELGIEVIDAVRLMTVLEARPEGDLHLLVYRVLSHRGQPAPCEQQALLWQHPSDIDLDTLLPADRPIADRLRLPPWLLITPDPMQVPAAEFLATLGKAIAKAPHLVRLRSARTVPEALVQDVETLVESAGSQLLLGTEDFPSRGHTRTGLCLRSQQLALLRLRPVPTTTLLMASIHHADDARRASELSCDLALISPIRPTPSHSGQAGIGWTGFADLHAASRLPAYALGGLNASDLPCARSHGALGVAGIRAFWV